MQTFDNQPSGGGSTMSSNPQRARSPRTMSQISGFKRPLMHTNSFTSDRLPVYGVETPHEATLGAMLNDINTWGIDIFKIGTLSCNRPLTCVAYQIFQVKEQNILSSPKKFSIRENVKNRFNFFLFVPKNKFSIFPHFLFCQLKLEKNEKSLLKIQFHKLQNNIQFFSCVD